MESDRRFAEGRPGGASKGGVKISLDEAGLSFWFLETDCILAGNAVGREESLMFDHAM